MTDDAEADLLDRLAVLVTEALTPAQREAALVTLTRLRNAANFHVQMLRRMR